jgi:hypothetical protein
VTEQLIPWWSTLSSEGSGYNSPDVLNLCPSHASNMRLTGAENGGMRSVPDPVTSHDSGFCKLRSPNLFGDKKLGSKNPPRVGKKLV